MGNIKENLHYVDSNQLLINTFKPLGKTPLDVINQIKLKNPHLKNTKMAYAGRLDPLANGVLLILVGEECKNRDFYQNLKKNYEFELLLGLSTDSFDSMGIVTNLPVTTDKFDDLEKIKMAILGIKEQEYPPYSSFRVKGKPLFEWAKQERLNEIILPKKKVNINNLIIHKQFTILGDNALESMLERLEIVKGEFRQKHIAKSLKDAISSKNLNFKVIVLSANVSSGTYIRGICNTVGEILGFGAIAFNIKRTSVGDFKINNSINFFT